MAGFTRQMVPEYHSSCHFVVHCWENTAKQWLLTDTWLAQKHASAKSYPYIHTYPHAWYASYAVQNSFFPINKLPVIFLSGLRGDFSLEIKSYPTFKRRKKKKKKVILIWNISEELGFRQDSERRECSSRNTNTHTHRDVINYLFSLALGFSSSGSMFSELQ